MGRPYANELLRLPETFEWALGTNTTSLVGAVRQASLFPLVAIGSGGALTASQFCVSWHQRLTGQLARAMTPLEVVTLRTTPRGAAVVLFSAGGENKDIRAAFEFAVAAEPPALLVMTAAPQSRLARAAREARFPVLVACDVPAGRDGFLATNSLLAFCVLTHRAYLEAAGSVSEALPLSWLDFTEAGRGNLRRTDTLAPGQNTSVLWDAESILVLHGYATTAAALDFESKCTEAALANVQVADYRNFAHGRHHWLAKKPASAVLALSTHEDERLATRTLAVLPRAIPVVHLRESFHGMLGGLRSLVRVMGLVQSAGMRRQIDPGRPGVPRFGSQLYSLRGVKASQSPRLKGLSRIALASIGRKLGQPLTDLKTTTEIGAWREAYERARASIQDREFAGIVFDYDGTLVDPAQRFTGPLEEVSAALGRLLAAGVAVGIATGRGRSVGRELRERMDRSWQSDLLVGYYNGGDIAPLSDESKPNGQEGVRDSLAEILAQLKGSKVIQRLATMTPRLPQITVEVENVAYSGEVWEAVQGIVLRVGKGVRLVRSSHSIDVLAPGVTKLTLVEALRSKVGADPTSPILRIGDRGRWPGNDAELLATLDGLSVHQVSADPEGAWNFAPEGWVGVRATLRYCAAMRPTVHAGVRIPDVELIANPSQTST